MRSARPAEAETSALEPRADFITAADLFPESLPVVAIAIWPNPRTRAGEALAAALAGPVNQYDYRGHWRLAASIQHLEDDGWRFITREVIRPNCRRPIAECSLDRADPGTAAALASRQKGLVDPTLAGLIALAAACAVLLAGGLPL
ncbi:MAG: hypothetical protein JNJ81_03620 [Candidatus Accumulibacter sp.]|nr:hypothetical protein [Accumulibacter sp.]